MYDAAREFTQNTLTDSKQYSGEHVIETQQTVTAMNTSSIVLINNQ